METEDRWRGGQTDGKEKRGMERRKEGWKSRGIGRERERLGTGQRNEGSNRRMGKKEKDRGPN